MTRYACNVIFASIVVVILVGCASGPGINRQQFFNSTPQITLPFETKVDQKSQQYTSGAIMTEGAEYQAFLTGGIPAMALMSNPKMVKGIRGSFSAGEVFKNAAQSLSFRGTGKSFGSLDLKLNYFQQYLIPGIAPRLKAIIQFSAHNPNIDKTTYSAYAFDWESQGAILSPSLEKDMLREMIEHVLAHWGQALLDQQDKINFPKDKRGEFSGNGVKCSYHIFYPL